MRSSYDPHGLRCRHSKVQLARLARQKGNCWTNRLVRKNTYGREYPEHEAVELRPRRLSGSALARSACLMSTQCDLDHREHMDEVADVLSSTVKTHWTMINTIFRYHRLVQSRVSKGRQLVSPQSSTVGSFQGRTRPIRKQVNTHLGWSSKQSQHTFRSKPTHRHDRQQCPNVSEESLSANVYSLRLLSFSNDDRFLT